MAFPEVQAWINGIVTLVTLIGAGLFVAAFACVGLIFMTTWGNERKSMFAKAAAGSALLGLFFVLAAPTIQVIIQRIATGK
jgi:hypothetical protein